jgi:hypothetical protein
LRKGRRNIDEEQERYWGKVGGILRKGRWHIEEG